MITISGVAIRTCVGRDFSLPWPARHKDVLQRYQLTGGKHMFVLSTGAYVGRKAAYHIAQEAGQLIREVPSGKLHSKDVW